MEMESINESVPQNGTSFEENKKERKKEEMGMKKLFNIPQKIGSLELKEGL